MKGTKAQKGITLIALIITIVVLLILAVVAISSIKNDGILGHATDAATDYNQAVKNEQDTLMSYEDFLKYQSCKGHEYDAEGKCTKCGYKPCTNHDYGEWKQVDCSKERTCSICGKKETVTEHATVETTYTKLNETKHSKNEVCTKCNTVLSSVEEQHTFVNSSCICEYACTNHNYGDWATVKAATCTTAGLKERTCSVCGNKGTADIPATGHSFYYGRCEECGQPCDHNYSNGECTICFEPCYHVEDVDYNNTTWVDDDGKQYHYAEATCAECGQYMWNGYYECTDNNADGKCDGCDNCTHKNGTRSWRTDEYIGTHYLIWTCPDCNLNITTETRTCQTTKVEWADNVSICDICGWYYSW